MCELMWAEEDNKQWPDDYRVAEEQLSPDRSIQARSGG